LGRIFHRGGNPDVSRHFERRAAGSVLAVEERRVELKEEGGNAA